MNSFSKNGNWSETTSNARNIWELNIVISKICVDNQYFDMTLNKMFPSQTDFKVTISECGELGLSK